MVYDIDSIKQQNPIEHVVAKRGIVLHDSGAHLVGLCQATGFRHTGAHRVPVGVAVGRFGLELLCRPNWGHCPYRSSPCCRSPESWWGPS